MGERSQAEREAASNPPEVMPDSMRTNDINNGIPGSRSAFQRMTGRGGAMLEDGWEKGVMPHLMRHPISP
ncbi:hypothetical protein [Prosthecochloris sp.]|uniref:hypothetical protein n=1 Tax=Prosthecochloris sp. TaxID=290513 RepID=UPI00257EC77A|nr:hypothetical protein [Prosthecochloris sp.]